MIELIVILSDKQQEELEKRATKAGYVDELEYLNLHLDRWLKPDEDRLEHTEK